MTAIQRRTNQSCEDNRVALEARILKLGKILAEREIEVPPEMRETLHSSPVLALARIDFPGAPVPGAGLLQAKPEYPLDGPMTLVRPTHPGEFGTSESVSQVPGLNQIRAIQDDLRKNIQRNQRWARRGIERRSPEL